MAGTRRPSRRRDLQGLTITELANLAGTTARALRYYEELDLLRPHRGERQERFYSSASVGKALQVVRMRRLGVPLADIARIMKDGDAGGFRRIIEEKLTDVESQREQLAALLQRLTADETAGWMREVLDSDVDHICQGRCEAGVESAASRL
ncbi:HTH-type transcriptional regulator TnrA [compost metagenome]